MVSAVLCGVGLLQLLLATAAFRARRSAGRWTGVLGCALAYDSLVVAAGGAMGAGPALHSLNAGRFVVHAVLTPVVIVCGVLSLEAGRRAVRVARLVTVALAAVGAATTLPGLRLEPRRWADTLRYVDVGGHGPPVAAVLSILVLLGIGLTAWTRPSGPWIALGAVAVLAASAAAFAVPPLGNAGEALMLAGLVAAVRARRTPGSGAREASAAGAEKATGADLG